MTPELEQAIQAEAQLQGYTGEHLFALRRGAELAAGEIERLSAANIIAEGLAKQNKEMAENFIALKQERDALQARVAELEAEKWNAQIAEGALASVEQERDELRFQADQARKTAQFHKDNHIAAEAVIDELRRRVDELEAQAQAVEDSEACAGAALMLVHDRFMRGVLTKEIMIKAVNSVGTKSIARIKAEAVREARECSVLAHERGNNKDYTMGFDDALAQYDAHMGKFADYLEANQIEGGT